MKIIVCMKEVTDPALSLDSGLRHGVVFGEGRPLRLNPDDAAALNIALGLKRPDNDEITLISIGTDGVESYPKNGLALGADKSVRIWSDDFGELSPYQKAVLLANATRLYGADLVLTGAASRDTASGQVGTLIAARLGLPCVTNVLNLEPDIEQKGVNLVRDIGRGEREKVFCLLPAVVTVTGEGRLLYASLDALVNSRYREIAVLTPTDLGVSPADLKKDPTRVARVLFPRPRPRKAPPLDSSLPAFDRILQLLEGGITKRKGLMLEGSPAELAESLFELLKEAGVIQPAGDR